MHKRLARATTAPELGRQRSAAVTDARRRPPNRQLTGPLTAPKTPKADEREEKDVPEEFIRVVARIRPAITAKGEDNAGAELLDHATIRLTNGRDEKLFAFDAVLDSRTQAGSQAALFDKVGKDLMQLAMKSINVCIFAYGHTGSGKTYTMLGDGASVPNMHGAGGGLLPRCIEELLQPHSESLRCSCEFYEVYNEQIRDLLSPESGEKRKRNIHIHPTHGVRVDGLSRSVVDSLEEVLRLVHFGNQIRTVSATTMNERSSRSHAIFTFRFEHRQSDHGNKADPLCQSTVTFVDLAGRENQESSSGGDKLLYRERCFINTSLFHLAHLITKLSEGLTTKNSLSDFRNSKLTLLLSQALAGSSRTALVVTVAPSRLYFHDSLSTLSFASTVKKIRTHAVVNKSSRAVIAELEAEVNQLKAELSMSTTKASEKELALCDAEALIAHYKQSWEDALQQSQKVEQRREKVAVSLGLRRHSSAIVPFLVKLTDDPALQGCLNYFLDTPLKIGSANTCNIVLQGVGIGSEMCIVRRVAAGGAEVELLGVGSRKRRSGIEMEDFDVEDGQGENSTRLTQNEDGQPEVPRVMLRGRALTAVSAIQQVAHGDSIILGYSHGFRLVCPATMAMASSTESDDPAMIARCSLATLDMASASAECADASDAKFKDSSRYASQLSSKLPKASVEKFMVAVQKMQPLVDEANVITKEIWGSEWLRFELHVLSNFLSMGGAELVPELVVCVLQKFSPISRLRSTVNSVKSLLRNQKAAEDEGGTGSQSSLNGYSMARKMSMRSLIGKERNPLTFEMGVDEHMKIDGRTHLLYVWSLEKFLSRLHEIRDLYQEGADAKDGFQTILSRLSTKRHLDPWREMSLADCRELDEARSDFASRSTPLGDEASMDSCSSRQSTPGAPTFIWSNPSQRRDARRARGSSRQPSKDSAAAQVQGCSARSPSPLEVPVFDELKTAKCSQSSGDTPDPDKGPSSVNTVDVGTSPRWPWPDRIPSSCSSPLTRMASQPRVQEHATITAEAEAASQRSCRRTSERSESPIILPPRRSATATTPQDNEYGSAVPEVTPFVGGRSRFPSPSFPRSSAASRARIHQGTPPLLAPRVTSPSPPRMLTASTVMRQTSSPSLSPPRHRRTAFLRSAVRFTSADAPRRKLFRCRSWTSFPHDTMVGDMDCTQSSGSASVVVAKQGSAAPVVCKPVARVWVEIPRFGIVKRMFTDEVSQGF
mmetsp:Transcript_62760/g.149753  ORF Transcript_62760/g.149753 Transcript_62760/m.149753 type:complete len:1223 (-) Transcript_62760:19-3687(-)|eukprot:CAMPEP_0178376650 /NCGR_PEP_ID=MMETSP0689_2-20121128/3511_1 /TAXON_ID=160604 /ORGANISM="Amphidinium massartii, Strain CS-259" /LENGTH=1222 /DNA_ID=CAMNT_0019996677 /DNA_START=44 /DNA_END=3712 /DNA_ORIENTATION=+